MKGVVLNKNNNFYTLLTEEGDYVKRKYSKDFDIGEEIDVRKKTNFNYKAIAAAAVVILLLGILTLNTFIIPYGYAEVAINPSVEIGYNKMYNVVKSVGLNDDGINLIDKSKQLRGMKLEDAVSYLIDEAGQEGYIKENEENYLVVAYTGKSSEKELEIEEKIKEKAENSGMEAMFMNVEKNQYSEMRNNKENPAVEGLKEKLIERNIPEEDVEDIYEVKDLARMLKNTEKEQNENGKPEDVGPDKETGPPEHADPQGKDKDKENQDGKDNKEQDNSQKPGKGNKGNGGRNWLK